MKSILGKKVGMTQIFTEEGIVIPVTVIEVGPMKVVQKKSVEKDGYNAIQVGYDNVKDKKVNKPLKGHFNKANVEFKKYLREIKVNNIDGYEIGQEIKADIFTVGDKVDVIGTSKGKGFQGVIKRYNYGRGPMTHGSKYHRGIGSMGGSATPSRILKGKKMPGQMGRERVTVQNLEVVRVDAENNFLLVKGAVPGPKGGFITIKETVKASK
ncbi:LSU ribosomal protein L3P [Proteiniborus ethanoligenes]|uniref:Large ribosomal subunit protein uL3 n=1 Tax=Proteiniborus ethanoligenes TaxID=415015 RepID=A0A1H3S1K9_9FIRM|nr:50S ribosomal protein L3 [Proteiniborus ethanoligenes]SDZ31677.1 LSU ribosomal protein L3P [Proteiniborus ethanoligenes]